MKFTAESHIENYVQHISGRLAKRLNDAKPWLEKRIKRKFSRDATGGTSNPGTYPKMLRGHLHSGIKVNITKGLMGLRRTGLSVNVEGSLARTRYFRLEKGFTITPKRAKRLAMPVSLLARKMASNGHGPRKFPHQLHLERVEWHGKKRSVLMTKTSATTRKIKGTDSPRGTIHYVLISSARVAPRRNLGDAMTAELGQLANFLLKKID